MTNCRSAARSGLRRQRAIKAGRLEMLAPFAAERITPNGDGLRVTAQGAGGDDLRCSSTGSWSRPDSAPTSACCASCALTLDPAVEAPPALAPLIDPNLHSCGTVPPHGAAELAHPEPGFFIVGAKSYGRAPTFLMATGYEQVRSVVAEIAGDHAAAREVRLVLPETGVCSAGPGRRGGDRLLRRSRAGGCGGLLRRRCRGEGCGPKWLRLRRVPVPAEATAA